VADGTRTHDPQIHNLLTTAANDNANNDLGQPEILRAQGRAQNNPDSAPNAVAIDADLAAVVADTARGDPPGDSRDGPARELIAFKIRADAGPGAPNRLVLPAKKPREGWATGGGAVHRTVAAANRQNCDDKRQGTGGLFGFRGVGRSKSLPPARREPWPNRVHILAKLAL
jgi:hypothetical protein